jgi:3'-phosphoadenosine 5'-phosphosulfate sulfotransferase (PAPS reductase)/FAD synthetase
MLELDNKIAASHALLDEVLSDLDRQGKEVVGIVGLFSGGNDSTTLAHLFRQRVTAFVHSNTQIGVEPTRQYVRDVCMRWGVPLLEGFPKPNRSFEALVLGEAYTTTPRAKYPILYRGGFPGPGAHGMFFKYLKGDWMNAVRQQLITNPRKQRLLYLGGRRSEESVRRKSKISTLGATIVRGSGVWVDVISDWTKADLSEYRSRCADCPMNQVAANLHMSGECLCGCYAHAGEYEEIKFWYPETTDEIDDLAARLKRKELDIPAERLRWGWNGRGRCASGLCNN